MDKVLQEQFKLFLTIISLSIFTNISFKFLSPFITLILYINETYPLSNLMKLNNLLHKKILFPRLIIYNYFNFIIL